MQIPFINKIASFLPPEIPLEKLAGNPNLSEVQKVAQVARQFESLLLKKILGQANKPMGEGSGVASEIYNDMVNTQLANSISQSGQVGMADALKGQLSHQALHQGGHAPTPTHLHPHGPSKILSPMTNNSN